jgi:hypothetical protein
MEVIKCTQTSTWDNHTQSLFYPFRLELSMMGNILLRRNRIVIPQNLRELV